MNDDAQVQAMATEIAALVGIRRRKPGWVTVQQFAEQNGVSVATAARHLKELAKKGAIVRERVLDNGKWCDVYCTPYGAS